MGSSSRVATFLANHPAPPPPRSDDEVPYRPIYDTKASRSTKQHCPRCGFDCRATPWHCSECGHYFGHIPCPGFRNALSDRRRISIMLLTLVGTVLVMQLIALLS